MFRCVICLMQCVLESDKEALQLVENEDMIGTLIDTNDRIIAALETYDTVWMHFRHWRIHN